MFGCSIAFMRMRSPSSAPPDLRRDGSMETIAIFSASRWSMRKRRTSSSVSELLPAPPVPVMPSVGTVAFAAAASSSARSVGGAASASSAVMSRASARVRANRSPSVNAVSDSGSVVREVGVGRGDDLVDHALQAELLPVLGREDAGDAVVVQLLDLGRNDHAAAAAEHLDVAGAALAQQVQHVLEELDVAALVGRDGDAVRVFLDRAVDDLLDRPVVAQMDDLAAGRLQDAPHDVDRRVVAVEQACRGHEADLVDRPEDQRMAHALIVHREPRVIAGGSGPAGVEPRAESKLTGTGRRQAPSRAVRVVARPYMTFT